MPDLRERLRAIESTPPPDLWTEIEARELEDQPEVGGAEIIAFEPRRPEWPRRLGVTAVAAALFILAAFPVWRAFRPSPEPPSPKPAELPPGWQRCTNGVDGYSIGFPGNWHTTDINFGDQDPIYACRWFSSEPFDAVDDQGRPQGNVVPEGPAYPMEVGVGEPLDVAIENRLDPSWVRDVGADPPRLLTREELLVDGHRAVRLEYETLAELIGSPGLHYEYLIELDPERTLIIRTTATIYPEPGDAYDANKRVLDLAADTVLFADPLPGTLPAGWQVCTNERVASEIGRIVTIGYPRDWHTTDVFFGERQPMDACRFFADVPFELQTDAGDPFGLAVEEGCGYPICLRLVPEPVEALVAEMTDPARIQIVSQEELLIGGRRAVRLDRVVLEPTLGEPQGPSYHLLIELDERITLLFTTEARDVTVGDPTGRTQVVLSAADFDRNRAVLDEMAGTLRLT